MSDGRNPYYDAKVVITDGRNSRCSFYLSKTDDMIHQCLKTKRWKIVEFLDAVNYGDGWIKRKA